MAAAVTAERQAPAAARNMMRSCQCTRKLHLVEQTVTCDLPEQGDVRYDKTQVLRAFGNASYIEILLQIIAEYVALSSSWEVLPYHRFKCSVSALSAIPFYALINSHLKPNMLMSCLTQFA